MPIGKESQAKELEKAADFIPSVFDAHPDFFLFFDLRVRWKSATFTNSIALWLFGHVNIKRNSHHSLRLSIHTAKNFQPCERFINGAGSV